MSAHLDSNHPIYKILSSTSPSCWALRYHQIETVNELLLDVLKIKGELSSCQHPDFLFLSPEENKNYKVEALEEFFSFTHFSPLTWPKKIVVFHNAHLLGDIVANKLLKMLEAPPEFLTIGLLLPGQAELMPTLESRAITWYMPLSPKLEKLPSAPTTWPQVFQSYLKNNSDQRELLEALWLLAGKKKSWAEVQSVIAGHPEEIMGQFLGELATSYTGHYELLEKHLQWERFCRQSKNYNNPASERITLAMRLWLNWAQFFPHGPQVVIPIFSPPM